ncbi:MAG: radical SAM protein [Synergistaceae bacterium]|jgi:pyruvate formate lyase activating enzyme|nr:radical SAM protein [Synergistaceae bacterium]
MNLAPRWWRPVGGGAFSAACDLCFRKCVIKKGRHGVCGARAYRDEGFVSPQLGRFISVAIDPIEKKPLRRWRPGSQILSLGGLRCNMYCPFCQNHAIAHPLGTVRAREISLESLVELAGRMSQTAVAYTYNEPALQAEYIFAASPILRENNIATVMVTNGMFSEAVCGEAIGLVDAMNVDVKTFDEGRYAELGGSLETVRRNVERLAEGGVHIEISNLIVPKISDDENDFVRLTEWLAGVSPDIPLHISRYFPAFRYFEPPTELPVMERFRGIASSRLKYVYLGNL